MPPAQPVDPESSERGAIVISQVRAAFLEMPGLHLTPAQAARLCALGIGECEDALTELVKSGFLMRTGSAMFARTN
jgi:hypothetical protein